MDEKLEGFVWTYVYLSLGYELQTWTQDSFGYAHKNRLDQTHKIRLGCGHKNRLGYVTGIRLGQDRLGQVTLVQVMYTKMSQLT